MKIRWLKQASLVLDGVNPKRRQLIKGLLAGSGLAFLGNTLHAAEQEDELRFPGEPAEHKVVYQFNKGGDEYHKAVLFSIGAMLRKYNDNVHIVVVGIGPGIHVLAKHPERPVSKITKQRISSLAQYGVEFHACGNTMKSLGWVEKDLLPFVKMVEVGAADLMELQEQGYSYINW